MGWKSSLNMEENKISFFEMDFEWPKEEA